MKITIETPLEGQEDEIIIRCAALDDGLLDLIYRIKQGNEKLTAYSDEGITRLSPKEIFYFEAVDNKVFAYCEKEVYEVKKKIYELEADYAKTDFIRVSKSTIINISKIVRLKPAFNGRFEAELQNGEKTIISRSYIGGLKNRLGI